MASAHCASEAINASASTSVAITEFNADFTTIQLPCARKRAQGAVLEIFMNAVWLIGCSRFVGGCRTKNDRGGEALTGSESKG